MSIQHFQSISLDMYFRSQYIFNYLSSITMDELIAELVIAVIVYICKTVYSIVTNAFTRVGNVIRRLFGVRPIDAQQSEPPAAGDSEVASEQRSSGNTRQQRQTKKQKASEEQSREQTKKKRKSASSNQQKSQFSVKSTSEGNKLLSLFSWLVVSVPQGYIGIQKTFGVLSPSLLNPGIHVTIPYVQNVIQIPTQIQTHVIRNIACGTSTGVLLNIDRIEVVSQLKVQYIYQTVKNYSTNYNDLFIRDRVHHQVNTFCSKYTVSEVSIELFEQMDEKIMQALRKENKKWIPGLEIIGIRITKPQIPESIRRNYEEMEKVKVQYQIQSEKQKILLQKQETRHKQALIKAQSNFEVRLIDLQKKFQVKKNELKMEIIQAEIYLQRKITEANNQFLIHQKKVQADKQILNPEYLRAVGQQDFSTNITFNLGDKIPTISF